MHASLPPELQALINEPLSEPPARAREHWKPLAKAMEWLGNLIAQQMKFDAEVGHLRERLELAKRRDDQALGEALANDRDEPEPEAVAIEAEIERNAKRASAMTGQILEARRAVTEVVQRNKEKWAGDLERHLAAAQAVYRAAIVARTGAGLARRGSPDRRLALAVPGDGRTATDWPHA
jgi:hypothetical protein